MKRHNYPIEKYRFTIEGNKVIAESSYGGKPVRAYAKCDPRDEFDLEKGKALAAARCNLKIADKRAKNAKQKLERGNRELDDVLNKTTKYIRFMNDANAILAEAYEALGRLEKSM